MSAAATASARQIAALVLMPRLLAALGFETNERTRRSACILHGGRNPSAFSWREDGRWHCHSCGRGGDRIALVQAVRGCRFGEAVECLAQLAGVRYSPHRVSRQEIERAKRRRERAEQAAWALADRVAELRGKCNAALLRADRLCWRIGEQIKRAATEQEREAAWDALARLAPVQTFFIAAWRFFTGAAPDVLALAALASPAERRQKTLSWEPVR